MIKLKEILQSRQSSYSQTFNTRAGEAVLKDLLRFCRVDKPCYNDNDRRHAFLEGRREVGMRIMKHLDMSFEQFFKEYYKGDDNA